MKKPESTYASQASSSPGKCAITMGWKIFGAIMSALFVGLAVALSSLAWAGHTSGTDAAAVPPSVVTPAGRILGSVGTSIFNGKSYVAYKAIPFAKPPLGALRFMRPQPPDSLSGTEYINSEEYKPSCWSITRQSTDAAYGEDCLYLNIYVPGNAPVINARELYPVMVWLHGGGFVAGSAFPEPIKMVTRNDVIIVGVNYRMGVFGFLTTLDANLPPNNGLWDMQMALKWVKENIKYFAGNDSSITVFGESSGSISASLLALSPAAGSLFNKAIFQSGTATTLLSRDAPLRAREFAAMVGCEAAAASSQLAQCLRGVSIADILKNSKPSSFNISTARRQADFIWEPAVDGEFIPQEPLALLSNSTYLKSVGAYDKDYIIGVLNNEGGLISDNFLRQISLDMIGLPGFASDMLDFLLNRRYNAMNATEKIKSAVYTFYNINPANVSTAQNVLDMSADLLFYVPAVETALALSRCSSSSSNTGCSQHSPRVFFYLFDYCPPITDLSRPQCLIHGADVAYELPRNNLTSAVQTHLSDIFIDLLTSFANNSNPGSAVSSGWPAFDPSSQLYLRLDVIPSVRLAPYKYRAHFWLDVVTRLIDV
ncbi:fatty acyl-CoA hydrolase precursor, medium chain-like isoform X3 [Biomphalaria glabrata]|uniref:Fatty acyl-CoA hydrolase precursor, medium chain-like isoform X3 n=1 Tax=Biomphalaria glabrata TaxID=6526 RepID=A0A9U8E3C0_BIOGL|nr:fatty acyl-CoA hydrolase precursor, medium chain-like isoform X3 [Biomphalaria glabrata]